MSKINSSELVKPLVVAATAVVVALIVAAKVGDVVEVMEQGVRSQAVDGCIAASQIEKSYEEGSVTTIEPMEHVYEFCLEDKGVKRAKKQVEVMGEEGNADSGESDK